MNLNANFVIASMLALCLHCTVQADLGGTGSFPSPSNEGSTTEPTIDASAAATAVDASSQEAKVDASTAEATDASADTSSDEPANLDGGADVRDAANDGPSVRDATADVPPDQGTPDRTIPTSCDDNLLDGDETDVDCGGSCPPCGLAQRCIVNSDCGTWPGCDPKLGCACDAVSKTCVYNHCFDYKQDNLETAVDCGGGECPGCGPNKPCFVDSDCSTSLPGCDMNTGGCYCDATTLTCVYNHCYDHKEDSDETALDCGGIHCPGCALGQNCGYDSDCASSACDAISYTCISNQCADRRMDGNETDVDCGGPYCFGCDIGQKCITSYDCATGTCNAGSPHVCN